MDFLFDPEILKSLNTKDRFTQILLALLLIHKLFGFAKKRRKNKRVKLTLIKGGKMDGKNQEQGDAIDQMTEAYDLKPLVKELEAAGLDGAEVIVAKAYPKLKKWFKKSASLSKPMADDIAAQFVDQADAFVLPQIDKINGKIGA